MDDLLDKFNSYPVAQKIMVFGLVVVAIFAVFWFLLYSPTASSYTSKKQQLSQKLNRLDELKNLKESQTKVREKVQKLRAQILLAEDKLPSNAQLPKLLKHIHDKAKTAGLEILNFKRKSFNQQNYYEEIPVEMKLQGTYGELLSFVQFVGNMNRIVNLRNLELSLKEGSRGELVVSTLATTYRYKDKSKGEK